ncbi:MAG: beta-carotene ketolase [Hyellaceae cyanobacterium CSU_1_1]|nr:beta-carotene ketolase [Hyellaceae cyanobacterium CSU_1_1]
MFFNQFLSRLTFANINLTTGIIVSTTLILFWFVSLIVLLALDINTIPLYLIILGIFLRIFLQTGLFITTHEAIHGTIYQNSLINDAFGYITSFLYAILPYKTLAKNHQLHHRHPASEKDPDFNCLHSNNFLFWYLSFMQEYQKGRQFWILLVGMTIIFCTFICLHISIINIFLFWIIPILISSVQLFTFGIFLPHRQRDEEYSDRHRARSNNYSVFWSFIACYHFGYHWEHHQYPNLPWYQLPVARQKILIEQNNTSDSLLTG